MKRILWFRRDLRVEDNPLLAVDGEVLPIFIFDTNILEQLSKNDRRVTFIFSALIRLKASLKKRGLNLAIFHGNPTEIFTSLLKSDSYEDVCASGDYDDYAKKRDIAISHLLTFTYFHDTYIFKPDEVLKDDGSAYLVFTPFYNRAKKLFQAKHMAEVLATHQTLAPFNYENVHHINAGKETLLAISLDSIGFNEQTLTKHQQLQPEEKLRLFASRLSNYKRDRDFFALDATSGLSTDLRFGVISIRRVLRWLVEQKKAGIETEPFFRQLIFREFYAMLLDRMGHLASQNFRYSFNGIKNSDYLEAFCSAKTGVPIVDAGVQELLSTGEMHNRVRMICASFFTKNLLLPWQLGERFFAQHLMDYDASSNALSWQWSAGTGVDPQPYFRIFNPYAQSDKFDSKGSYIKKHLSELAGVSPKIVSDETALNQHSLDNYPKPIVNHKDSSKRALEYFKSASKTRT